jgi:hypothetical protein
MDDLDPMPFGKYKGIPMGEVPSDYLDWLIGQDWIYQWPDVEAYINDNLDSIQEDIKDD